MARPLRIEFPGALYHITSRGNERRNIYLKDAHYIRFINLLKKAVERYHVIIHAFCLMPNHYHLEVETLYGNLSQTMQWINTSYTVYFNRNQKRKGHLLQGRYKAVLVQKEGHLAELSRYIHLNPVRAKMVNDPAEYTWSSYSAYLGYTNDWDWLNTGWILEQYGTNPASQRRNYQKFVEAGMYLKGNNPLKQAVSGLILGSDSFVDHIKASLSRDPKEVRDLPQLRSLKTRIDHAVIIKAVASVFECEEFFITHKGSHNNRAREVAIYFARRYSGSKNAYLGSIFGGIAGTNISYIYRKVEDRLKEDIDLQRSCSKVDQYLFPEV
jgi:REP element-mobilizing transposase RayT